MSTSDATSRVIGGRYRLERHIGQGGMGTVWRGRDELLGRDVAVKEVRFPPELGGPEQQELRERTLREARATARLSHPNVVTTYDVVEEDGRPWIVMELVPSRSLSEVLHEDGPLPPHRVAEIGVGMLGALEASHKLGVVHRDVKPGNVLITEDGRAVLTDFGIATMAGDPSLTSTGVVLGSPAYMSPERARGRRPGAAADMWSLGATLYAAAEGRPPFDSDSALGTLTAVISEPVDPPTVEGPLREAILGLLEKEPADRMDIEQTRALLTRAAGDRSTGPTLVPAAATVALDRAGRTEALPVDDDVRRPAPPAAPPTEGDDERRRRPVGLIVLIAALALLLLGVGLFAFLDDGDGQQGAEPSPSRSQQPSTPNETRTTPESSPTTSAEEDDGIPAGFVRYEDPSGFALAVPEGWQPVRDGTRVDFRDPGGSRFLRIDQTDDPKDDPKKDWEQQEKDVEDELPNYERIEIEEVDYNDWPAADWEFTFGEDTHVVNRGFVPNEDQGYAIYLSAPEDQWDESQTVFDVATESFEPAD